MPQCPSQKFILSGLGDLFSISAIYFLSGCGKSVLLADLPDNIRCNIPSYCTGVECSVYSGTLGYMFKTEVNIDACSKMIVVKIERLSTDIYLVEDQFKTEGEYWLYGVVRLW